MSKHKTGNKSHHRPTIALDIVQEDILYSEEPESAYCLLAEAFPKGHVTVVLDSDRIGAEPEDASNALLISFLKAAADRTIIPDRILFYGRGVLLLDSEHPVWAYVEKIQQLDVRLRACKESLLEHKKEPPSTKVETVSMEELSKDMLRAERLIRP